ncbi:hypothetical protein HELRODRAFT_171671 [Helobdella robusta]|uniref:Uncharacterized protein n=1 Tax=Helobdella robusta TaxID=6412 RepID=T1F4J2_HELRO|nr:hypothetical protein HELRODRAFT_171671 [Helobdella robusta]ESO05304.1 hypothetical protein HELRODRAFT_171671 [Helobdella robusta]
MASQRKNLHSSWSLCGVWQGDHYLRVTNCERFIKIRYSAKAVEREGQKKYTKKELAKDIMTALFYQWTKANSKHLIQELDGPTLSNNRWSGPIGKILDDAIDLEINPNFIRITVGLSLIELKQSFIDDLSTDQYYGYMIVNAIRSGVVPDRLANLQIGPVCHSRWLTTALRCCRLWVSNHGLKDMPLRNLKLIVEFIVGVYMPNWFNIKVKHSWIDGPRPVLFQLELFRIQDKEVMQIVMPVVRRSANVQMGDMSLRQRVTPEINPDASSLLELIHWDSEMYESPLTCSLTTAQVKQFLHTPMIVPDWPSHIQSIERCVKIVTEASEHVYSQERRDGYIRSQIVSRQLMCRNANKKDMYIQSRKVWK